MVEQFLPSKPWRVVTADKDSRGRRGSLGKGSDKTLRPVNGTNKKLASLAGGGSSKTALAEVMKRAAPEKGEWGPLTAEKVTEDTYKTASVQCTRIETSTGSRRLPTPRKHHHLWRL